MGEGVRSDARPFFRFLFIDFAVTFCDSKSETSLFSRKLDVTYCDFHSSHSVSTYSFPIKTMTESQCVKDEEGWE